MIFNLVLVRWFFLHVLKVVRKKRFARKKLQDRFCLLIVFQKNASTSPPPHDFAKCFPKKRIYFSSSSPFCPLDLP